MNKEKRKRVASGLSTTAFIILGIFFLGLFALLLENDSLVGWAVPAFFGGVWVIIMLVDKIYTLVLGKNSDLTNNIRSNTVDSHEGRGEEKYEATQTTRYAKKVNYQAYRAGAFIIGFVVVLIFLLIIAAQ